MILPPHYYSQVLAACIIAAVMTPIMMVFIWATRKIFSRDAWQEGMFWGVCVIGPFADRILRPLLDAAFK